MHELGIVFYIIDDVEEVVEKDEQPTVYGVTLEVGADAGVVPSYLDDVWNWAVKKHECMTEAKLNVINTPAVTYCENCAKTYATVKYGRQCPYSESGKTYLHRSPEHHVKGAEAH